MDRMDTRKKKERFLEAYKRSWGNISVACEAVGIVRQTFYNWRDKDPKWFAKVVEIEERTLDMAETKLIKAIQEEKTAELLFYLKTKGKKRGYVERQEITGAGGSGLDVRIEIVD